MNNSSQLTPTQELVLKNAAKRGGSVMPLPDNLKGGAAKKVFDSLLGKGFIGNLPASEGSDAVLYQITDTGREAIGEEISEAVQEDVSPSFSDEKEEVTTEPEAEPETASVDEEVEFEPTDTEEDVDAEPDTPIEAEEAVQTTEDTEQADVEAEKPVTEPDVSPELKNLSPRARTLLGILQDAEDGITALDAGKSMGIQEHTTRSMISRNIQKGAGYTVIKGKNNVGVTTYKVAKEKAEQAA